ncbi:FMN-binding negative transcriptional regulator [Bradyrhizobium sp. i1.15.2]|uniref:FMN-binding negative transcriptional regulator n=1 Tax=Bradyrhizobium sp. i1.15.2 TaxID=3156362 RepID=UPI003393C4B6
MRRTAVQIKSRPAVRWAPGGFAHVHAARLPSRRQRLIGKCARQSATLITATHEGLVGALPVVFDESEGSMGNIYARLARSSPHWKLTPTGEAMAIFAGARAYVSPSWT